MAKEPKKISIIERRLQGGSALQVSSQPIPMKEKGWTLYWENNDVRPDQVWHTVNVLGWEYVQPDDVACGLDDIGAKAQEGRVVRGERGKEVLLKMRDSDYKKLQAKKAKENVDITFDRKRVKNAVLNDVASAHGSEAAEFLATSNMQITDTRRPYELPDE
jgi:hypothetical protein